MKLIDAMAVRQGKFEIPDCSRYDMPGFFKELGYKVGAEIGVFRGGFTKHLCRAGLKVFAIDPWMAYVDWMEKKGWPKDLQEEQDKFYEFAKHRLSRFRLCTIVRKTSMEAVKDFDDESLDFVYIDGHHGFQYIAEDLCQWTKKVRKGGIVSGHDYIPVAGWTCHVMYVVDAYVQAFGIKDWWVLGREAVVAGEARDRARSWMWFKE